MCYYVNGYQMQLVNGALTTGWNINTATGFCSMTYNDDVTIELIKGVQTKCNMKVSLLSER